MRIAFVHSFYSSRQPSGENNVVESEIAALRRAGHEVALCAARTDDLERSLLYPIRAGLRVATGVGRNPSRAIEAFKPDVVHVHNLFPNWGEAWVRDVKAPLVTTLHNYRPICANGVLFRDGHVCTLCPEGRPWSGFRYKCYRGSYFATFPLSYANRNGPMHHPVLSRSDRLVFLSDRQLAMYERAGLATDRSVVWPNFLVDDLDPKALGEANQESPWLFAGRLSVEKGLKSMIASWPPDVHLRIVGEGPEGSELRRLARGKAIDFIGNISRRAVLDEMSRSIGLVFPSIAIEGFPLVYIEALACGRPVLAFGDNIVSTLTSLDGTGWTAYLPQQLGEVLAEARTSAPHMRDRCRAVFEKLYSEAAYVERANALYTSLVGS